MCVADGYHACAAGSGITGRRVLSLPRCGYEARCWQAPVRTRQTARLWSGDVYVVNQKTASARWGCKGAGLGSYHTAWEWCQLRRAMAWRDRLSACRSGRDFGGSAGARRRAEGKSDHAAEEAKTVRTPLALALVLENATGETLRRRSSDGEPGSLIARTVKQLQLLPDYGTSMSSSTRKPRRVTRRIGAPRGPLKRWWLERIRARSDGHSYYLMSYRQPANLTRAASCYARRRAANEPEPRAKI